MSTRTIYGNINAGSSIYSGSGDFRVRDSGEGHYIIEFNTPFTSIPAVVATQNWPGWNDFKSWGGNTRDNVTIVAVNQRKVRLKTGDTDGNPGNRNFSFIAVGS